MDKFRKISFNIGLALCVTSVLLLLGTVLFPNTYFIIALSKAFELPFVWGMFFIILSLLLKREKKKKSVFIKKTIYILLLFPLINWISTNTFIDSFHDIQAVITDDLYVTEGKITKTSIERKSGAKVNLRGPSDKYFQHIRLDNEHNDEFVLQVEHKEHFIFEPDRTYRITALPNSRTLLKFEEE